jgi:hypothetical protein
LARYEHLDFIVLNKYRNHFFVKPFSNASPATGKTGGCSFFAGAITAAIDFTRCRIFLQAAGIDPTGIRINLLNSQLILIR